MSYSSCFGDASRLGDGCGAFRLGGVGVNWGSRAQKGGVEFRGACLQEVLTGQRFFVTIVELVLIVGLVLCPSMSKY